MLLSLFLIDFHHSIKAIRLTTNIEAVNVKEAEREIAARALNAMVWNLIPLEDATLCLALLVLDPIPVMLGYVLSFFMQLLLISL